MSNMPSLTLPMASVLWSLTLPLAGGEAPSSADWTDDFQRQPIPDRPSLEVRYTDSSREAFEVVAETYHVRGSLRAPPSLVEAGSGASWLGLCVVDSEGHRYETSRHRGPTRINLYRRGPWYCEVHWLDVGLADAAGRAAPLRGDLTLRCFPDRLLASITWHATEDFPARALEVTGKGACRLPLDPMRRGGTQSRAWPLHGIDPPLAASHLETLEATSPLRYDPSLGCYRIGSESHGAFEGHFYRHPNRYETVRFRVRGDDRRRVIYVCHETDRGNRGCVEGGVLLDAGGHPLPLLVQVSKNFAGEREEKFYNPKDTPFSETWFPIRLEPGETCTVESLHLYQNWGSHMVKQFSSLGAWMDYFHSSTGVTETTCYVPFKYRGLGGISIADLRAMSQETFWAGQPQHDNVAGHSFLSYRTDAGWQHLVYRSTLYRSTGPNWMDVGLSYRSSDGKVDATVRAIEFPQADELRSFVRVSYEFLGPLSLRGCREDLRLLSIASHVQRLRYRWFAASGHPARRLDAGRDHVAVRGAPLPASGGFAALYGERKGSNAIILRSWRTSAGAPDLGPAASVRCEASGDTTLSLVADRDELSFTRGDRIELDAIWLPYGEVDGCETPEREAALWSTAGPRITRVERGRLVAGFPPTVEADGDEAEIELAGGMGAIAVLLTGLSDWRWPLAWRRESRGWTPIDHSRVGALDGAQVASDGDGRFRAVFLVDADPEPQTLRLRVGRPAATPDRWSLVSPAAGSPASGESGAIAARLPGGRPGPRVDPGEPAPPGTAPDPAPREWRESEAGSLWYEASRGSGRLVGGRVTPTAHGLEIEAWHENRSGEPCEVASRCRVLLGGTEFDDPEGARTLVLTNGSWQRLRDRESRVPEGLDGAALDGASLDAPVVVVRSDRGGRVLALAWPRPLRVRREASPSALVLEPSWPRCPPRRRAHQRGRLWMLEGDLDDVLGRVRREIRPLEHRQVPPVTSFCAPERR